MITFYLFYKMNPKLIAIIYDRQFSAYSADLIQVEFDACAKMNEARVVDSTSTQIVEHKQL